MHDRKPQILQIASELLQTRSYTSFSYQDLSDRLGIRKASIHHHFATKEDLLYALTERYRRGLRERLRAIDETYGKPWERLEAYLANMSAVMESGNKICPIGALTAEFTVIPQRAQENVRQLYELGKHWLADVLAQGKESGDMDFEGSAEDRAALILAAIQGALQVARANGPREFSAVTREIRAGLKPKARLEAGN